MLRDITAGQLACIGEVARRIYHQIYPLMAQDVTYFDDRSLVLRSLFSARVSFRRKKAGWCILNVGDSTITIQNPLGIDYNVVKFCYFC